MVITKSLNRVEMRNDYYEVLTFIAGMWFSAIVSLVNCSRLTVGAITAGANGSEIKGLINRILKVICCLVKNICM